MSPRRDRWKRPPAPIPEEQPLAPVPPQQPPKEEQAPPQEEQQAQVAEVQPAAEPPQEEQPPPQEEQQAQVADGTSDKEMPAVGGGLGESQPSAGLAELPVTQASKRARTAAVARPAAGGSAPPVPTPITSADVISAGAGAADPVAKYIVETVDYVNYHLTRYLTHPPQGSRFEPMKGPLAKQPPIDIESMAVGQSLTSFRESYKYNNAQQALKIVSMYEGAGNLFWFDAKAPNVWKAKSLGGSALSLAQVIAARSLFTRDQLIASNPDNENCNRFASPASPNKGMCFVPWSWFLVDVSLILVSCFLLYGWMWDLSRIRCFLNARGSIWEALG